MSEGVVGGIIILSFGAINAYYFYKLMLFLEAKYKDKIEEYHLPKRELGPFYIFTFTSPAYLFKFTYSKEDFGDLAVKHFKRMYNITFILMFLVFFVTWYKMSTN